MGEGLSGFYLGERCWRGRSLREGRKGQTAELGFARSPSSFSPAVRVPLLTPASSLGKTL